MADRNNVLHIQFTPCSNNYETDPLYQYDYGQIIKFSGVTLPDLYEVHFAHSKHGEAKTVIGNSDGVDIPDEYLETAAKIYGWIYLHTGEDDGETVYRFIIPVIGRAKPTHEEPTPVQQTEIEQLIATLENLIENYGGGGSGGGADGVSPTVTITEITGGHRVTITDKDHPSGMSFDVLNGVNGANGVSPVVSVSAITGGNAVTITDATHPQGQTFNVMNGTNGNDYVLTAQDKADIAALVVQLIPEAEGSGF